MLIIFLLVLFATVMGIIAIMTLFTATTDIVERVKRIANAYYDRFVRFVKWAAAKPIVTWPVLLGAACLAVRVGTIACSKEILHVIWGDWAHLKVIIPLMSDMIDVIIKYVRKQHPFLKFLIKLVEVVIQMGILILVIVARIACNPDIPLVMFWSIAVPVFASIAIWKAELQLPASWRRIILTDRDGGERPIEGLRNKVLFMCVATLVIFGAVIVAAYKTPPVARMTLFGSTDVIMLVLAVVASQIFTTILLSLQLDGDTVQQQDNRISFWDEGTTYAQYHYTLFVACIALAMLLIIVPFCNTALFAYKRMTRA